PGDSDENADPARFGEELVGRPGAFFDRIVARHPHVTAERQRANAVIRVAALRAEQAQAESERKNLHAHAGELGGDEMSPFMHEDHDAEDNRNGKDCDHRVLEICHGTSSIKENPRPELCGYIFRATASRARRRASASALKTSSIVCMAVLGVRSSPRSITAAIPVNGSRRSRNAATAISSAAFKAHGQAPPCRSASFASVRHGNFRAGTSAKSSFRSVVQSSAHPLDGTRSG